MSDIKGKKIAMGGPGSIDIDYCETFLGAVGLEIDWGYISKHPADAKC